MKGIRREFIGLPTLRQRDVFDCGVALAEAVLLWANRPYCRRSLSAALRATRLAGTDPEDLAAILEAAGLRVEVIDQMERVELTEAIDAGSPVCVCVTPADGIGHWLGCVGWSKRNVFALDPWTGRIEPWQWRAFLGAWHDTDKRRRRRVRMGVVVSR